MISRSSRALRALVGDERERELAQLALTVVDQRVVRDDARAQAHVPLGEAAGRLGDGGVDQLAHVRDDASQVGQLLRRAWGGAGAAMARSSPRTLVSPRATITSAPHHSHFTIALRLGVTAYSTVVQRVASAPLGPDRRGRRIAPPGCDHRGAHVRLRCASDPDHARRGPLPVDRPFGELGPLRSVSRRLCWTQAEGSPQAGPEAAGQVLGLPGVGKAG